MYKLLLVDDEAEVREGMIRRIDWHAHGFRISGEAENGREALDLVEREMPDVVVTDISMPVMDGIALGHALRERFPTIRTVFLTGFDEFSYAQQAIRMQAEEYVLKPVSAASMGELLDRLRARLDAEAERMEDLRHLRDHFRQSLPMVRDRFLTSLLHRPAARDMPERAATLGLRLDAPAHMVAAIAIDESGLGASPFHDDPDLALYAVLNLADELADRHLPHLPVLEEEQAILVFQLEETTPETAYGLVWTALEAIRLSVERHLHFTVSIGVGTLVTTPGELHASYRQALAALEYRMVHGANRILYVGDVERQDTPAIRLEPEAGRRLHLAVKIGDPDTIHTAVEALFLPLSATRTTLAGLQAYLLGVLGLVAETAVELGIDTTAILSPGENWLTPLSLETLAEIRTWVERTCTALGSRGSGQRQTGLTQMIAQAKAHVRAHYSDPDLSVPSVARMLHLSASHFSALFKKETGETFLNHVLRIRMEAARELLATTDLRTAEIAERVGYPDPHYFSHFFKKNLGVSPKEFRQNLKR